MEPGRRQGANGRARAQQATSPLSSLAIKEPDSNFPASQDVCEPGDDIASELGPNLPALGRTFVVKSTDWASEGLDYWSFDAMGRASRCISPALNSQVHAC